MQLLNLSLHRARRLGAAVIFTLNGLSVYSTNSIASEVGGPAYSGARLSAYRHDNAQYFRPLSFERVMGGRELRAQPQHAAAMPKSMASTPTKLSRDGGREGPTAAPTATRKRSQATAPQKASQPNYTTVDESDTPQPTGPRRLQVPIAPVDARRTTDLTPPASDDPKAKRDLAATAPAPAAKAVVANLPPVKLNAPQATPNTPPPLPAALSPDTLRKIADPAPTARAQPTAKPNPPVMVTTDPEKARRRATELLQAGRVDDARAVLTQVGVAADGKVLAALASTYDPVFLAAYPRLKPEADWAFAGDLYRQAIAKGYLEALVPLAAMEEARRKGG